MTDAPPGFCADPTGAYFQASVTSSDVDSRRSAVASCGLYASNDSYRSQALNSSMQAESPVLISENAGRNVVKVALSDHYLSVRAQAVNSVNLIFHRSPGFPSGGFDLLSTKGVGDDTRDLRDWWHSNEPDIEELAFFTYVTTQSPDLGNLAFYGELKRFENTSYPALKKTLTALRDQARSLAAGDASHELIESGKNTEPDSCSSVEVRLKHRLSSFSNEPENETEDDGRLFHEIAFEMKNCDLNRKLLPEVAQYAIETKRLSRHYDAVVLINKWLVLTLDPYDPRSFQDWWDKNEAAYQQ